MTQRYKFRDLRQIIGAGGIRAININDLYPKPKKGTEGKFVPSAIEPFRFDRGEIFSVIRPYVSVRFRDQFKAVVPLAVYLALFLILILRQPVDEALVITAGLFSVIVGLMFFMEGLRIGLMPFGTIIGHSLPQQSPLPVVLLITFLLGIGVTFAEPAIGALQAAVANISVERAPYLYALLNEWSGVLVLVVGAAVGLAAVLGTLRFLYDWSLKPLIYAALLPVLALTLYASTDPHLTSTLGLAWDAGTVTTGPVTVPLVLAMGLGFGNATDATEGFGILCMASIGPIISVMITGLWSQYTVYRQAKAAEKAAITAV